MFDFWKELQREVVLDDGEPVVMTDKQDREVRLGARRAVGKQKAPNLPES